MEQLTNLEVSARNILIASAKLLEALESLEVARKEYERNLAVYVQAVRAQHNESNQ